MFHRLHSLHFWVAYPRSRPFTAAVAAAAMLLVFALWLLLRTRKVAAEELERRRRDRLAVMGRITDGSLLDARTLANEEVFNAAPEILFYRYRLAGVTYECAQDVSRLPEASRGCHIGGAVQVRYDPRNPGDSIVLADSWSGLWLPGSTSGQPPLDAT